MRDDLEESVVATIQNPQTAFGKEQIETITHQEGKIIGKLRLAIPSQNISKRKGPRAIVLVDKNKQASWLLLIYTKDNVKGSHETAWWKGEIKAAYPKLKDLL